MLTPFLHSTNLVIILGMMQVSKKVPFDDPQVLLGVRGFYIISNLIIAAIYLFMQQKINSKKGMWNPNALIQWLSYCLHIVVRLDHTQICRTSTHGFRRGAEANHNNRPFL